MTTGAASHWRANFFAGLAIVLPAVISIAVVVWLFGTVSNITDTLLLFLPRHWTHQNEGTGPMHWYWSLFALVLTVLLICAVGRMARHYFGRKLIELADATILRVPLINKIYAALKQVNEAFSSNKKSSFKQVVLLEFPRAGQFSVGFITNEQNQEIHDKLRQRDPARAADPVVSVFIPTTPNPTSGFLVLVPESSLTKLEMSVADGIKFIISLGSVSPDYRPGAAAELRPLNVTALTPAPDSPGA